MRSTHAVFLSIVGLVAFTVAYFLFLNDVARSITWHLAHGDTAAYNGHRMTLPLLWRVGYVKTSVLKLSRAAFFHPFINAGLSGPEFLVIGSMPGYSGTFDDAAASRWQSSMVASFRASNSFASPETLHSKTITFYCFNRDDASTHAGALDCRAAGTDWEVIFGVGDGGAGSVESQVDEARAILRSMQ